MNKSMDPSSNPKFYSYMVLMVISGALNTIIVSLQNKQVVHKSIIDGELHNIYYSHPWIQTLFMFVGESYCFLFYTFQKKYNISEATLLKKDQKINVFTIIIPTVFDLLSTTMYNFGLINLPASIFLMFTAGVIILTSLFRFIFLKKSQNRKQTVGIIMVTIGTLIIGFGLLFTENSKSNRKQNYLLGILATILGLVFEANQFVVEEYYLSNLEVHPLKFVGWEGIWGTILMLLIIPFLSKISCNNLNFKNEICSISADYENYYVESPISALIEIFRNKLLFFLIIASTFACSFFNFAAVTITQGVSASHRTILDNSKSILVWIIFLISGHENFLFLELLGFAISIFGSFVYNDIIEISYLNRNQTKESTDCKKIPDDHNFIHLLDINKN